VVHLTEDSYCQHSARHKTFDDCLIKTSVPEQVTDDDIDRRPFGETGIEIQDLEPTAIADPITRRQVTGEAHRHSRDVDSVHGETPYSEPDGCQSSSTCKVDRMTTRRNQVFVRGKESWRTGSAIGPEPLEGVFLIPMQTILFGH
jgi:hypothetical protein